MSLKHPIAGGESCKQDSFLRCYFIDVTIMTLSGKNEENKSMKKAKRCLIAVVSGVLVALLSCLDVDSQRKKYLKTMIILQFICGKIV